MIVHDLIRVVAAILDCEYAEVRIARVRNRRQHDTGRRNADHEQRIDTLRGKPRVQPGTIEHAGTMRDDERFSGLLAEFWRYLVVDEKTKLLDSLPVPVQRTNFRIARTKVDLGEIDADTFGPRSVTQLARIGEQRGRDRWK